MWGVYEVIPIYASASKVTHYFLVALGLSASSPPVNITLNASNKKTGQSLSDFQTGIGAAAYATLDTEQLISHIRTVFVDNVASLQGSGGRVIQVSEVHELLIKIHDIVCLNWLVVQLVL